MRRLRDAVWNVAHRIRWHHWPDGWADETHRAVQGGCRTCTRRKVMESVEADEQTRRPWGSGW